MYVYIYIYTYVAASYRTQKKDKSKLPATWRAQPGSVTYPPFFVAEQEATYLGVSSPGSVSKPCTPGEHQNSW